MFAVWTADAIIKMVDGAIAYLKSKGKWDRDDYIVYNTMHRFINRFDLNKCPQEAQSAKIRDLRTELEAFRPPLRAEDESLSSFYQGDD